MTLILSSTICLLSNLYFFSIIILRTGISTSNYALLRYLHVVTHMTGILILSAYSAFLISALSSRTVNLSFDTLAGLAEVNNYKFGVSDGSAEYKIFKASQIIYGQLVVELFKIATNNNHSINI